ncbi:DUF1127 domain-containing protein [Pelagovum pacificum]|uniref:DUF1127 domain-containing protein n=1 Tax=Pelagovum pacificum TaxID=2588711 RepID=A0A5C5GDA1_9RHOB|nr:DUF1127 domain-containing protein [Pelagovum pacificum]QQA44152.1 DUF1127 domain-containing protein [Pelagovum pacificum]TNY32723.1 DUF1127 domain-containing protein [Pelagovum pacificum]
MATYTDTRGLAGNNLFARFNGFVSEFREHQARHQVYRQTLVELGQLTDRDLADLGVHRSQIRGIAREAAYGK